VLARVPTYGLGYIFPFYQLANLENADTLQYSATTIRLHLTHLNPFHTQ